MMKRNVILLASLLVLFGSVMSVYAEPIYWEANGHYYERVENTSLNWDAACDAAAASTYLGMSGHLVTITSAEEQQFLEDNSLTPTTGVFPDRYWIGAFQPEGSPEPAGNWQWITGEIWDYTNWFVDAPNNEGDEDVAHLCQGGVWNDLNRNNSYERAGYVVEYSAVPEPSTASMLIVLCGSLAFWVKRKRGAL